MLTAFTTLAVLVGCYTVNLQVSAERAQVKKLRQQVQRDVSDIQDLQAELDTRAGQTVMQRWNDDVLQMSAPAALQYLRSPVQLASFVPAPAAQPMLRNAVTPAEPVIAKADPVIRVAFAPAAPAAASARPQVVNAAYALPRATPADDVDVVITEPRELLPEAPQ
ncbi:MAG: hypothetical protein CFE37_08420 [Alphaproteobacteria bacterium PA4]|nr:MAG: hypothetical protein CFE37_08420 [Alphaproteobacteria bacterium PA4]